MSIGQRLTVSGFVAILLMAAVGAMGIWGMIASHRSVDRLNTLSAAIRNQMQADMMHDALRADALLALREGRNGNRAAEAEVTKDTTEHIKDFTDNIAANLALDLPADARAALDDVGPALAAYGAAAGKIVKAAFNDNFAANQDFPAFLDAFHTLEEKMEAIGDTIQADAQATQADAAQTISGMQIVMIAVLMVAAALLLAIQILTARSVVRPLSGMTQVMEKLAAGDTAVEIPAAGRRDEVGAMASAVQVFKDNAIVAMKLAAEQAQDAAKRENRAAEIDRLCRDFEANVSTVLKSVVGAVESMKSAAQSMSQMAGQTASEATNVSTASGSAAESVNAVAAATEELSGSVNEISRQMARSTEITAHASEQATRTNDQIRGLADAAQKVGDVVQLITDIANQTNLLALNATIEAARAGDAGKGFAVVASEVKNLATQTARATDEISQQINAIQTETSQAVSAIQSIGGTIGEIDQITTAVATAVQEQGTATEEIARSVERAANGTRKMTASIDTVASAAAQTGSAATQILAASEDLGHQSDALRGEVEQFLKAVRAA